MLAVAVPVSPCVNTPEIAILGVAVTLSTEPAASVPLTATSAL